MQIKKAVDAVFKAVKSHSGTICAGAAIVGVGATVYFSGKAAVEVDHEIDPSMTKKEKAKVYAKAYWKTAVVSGLTVGAIVGSDRFHVKKEVGLAGTAALLKSRNQMLDQKAREKFGDAEVDDIYREMAEEEISKHVEEPDAVCEEPEVSKPSNSEKMLYLYEPVSGQGIDVTYEKLLEALLEMNFRLQKDFSAEFNAWLDFLGDYHRNDMTCYYWDLDSESQQYAASYAGSFVIDFPEAVWDKIKYWANSETPMTTDDRINLSYLIYPDEVLPWDTKTT